MPFRPASHLSMYFYPRSPCGERRKARPKLPKQIRISIHALLAESDTTFQKLMAALLQFLSTLSLRRATCRVPASPCPLQYFYPRSPCGERPYGRINDISRLIFLSTLSLRRATSFAQFLDYCDDISIHALLAESDRFLPTLPMYLVLFLSTLSLRRATSRAKAIPAKVGDFYPRSPCGERPSQGSDTGY